MSTMSKDPSAAVKKRPNKREELARSRLTLLGRPITFSVSKDAPSERDPEP